MEGGSRHSTRPYRVTHHDRIQDCHNPWGHRMGNNGHVPWAMAWGKGQYICPHSETASAPGYGGQLDLTPEGTGEHRDGLTRGLAPLPRLVH